jgi:hypothetical protein
LGDTIRVFVREKLRETISCNLPHYPICSLVFARREHKVERRSAQDRKNSGFSERALATPPEVQSVGVPTNLADSKDRSGSSSEENMPWRPRDGRCRTLASR